MSIISFFLFYNIISLVSPQILQKVNKKIINIGRALNDEENTEIIINNTNKVIIVGENDCRYITNYVDENGQIFFESKKEESKDRYVYALKNNGRGYYNDYPIYKYQFNTKVKTYTGNSLIIESNNKTYLFSKICDGYYFEILDLSTLNSNFYYSSRSIVPNSLYIYSYVNSFFKLKNETSFIFGYYHSYQKNYLTNGYKAVLLKGSLTINSTQAQYSTPIRKVLETSYISTSFSCFETTNYINCFYVNNAGNLAITIFDKDLEPKKEFYFENNRACNETNFRKGIFLKNETCVYAFYENNEVVPIITINYITYDTTNGFQFHFPNPDYGFITIDADINSDNSCDLNDLIKLREDRFMLISAFKNKKYFLILLFDLFNNDANIVLRKYIFNLNGYNIYTNLRLFMYRNFVGFSYCYGDEKACGFRILNYGNTTDYEKIDDFLNKLYIINPLNLRTNIEIENNLFDYELTGIKIISIPNQEKTRLSMIKTSNLEEITIDDNLKKSSIIFSYIGNKEITNGDYKIEFAPIVSEKSYEDFNSRAQVFFLGESEEAKSVYKSMDYVGRHGYFVFNLINHEEFKCHEKCYSCYKSSISDNEQYCVKCKSNYYFIENTDNCSKDPIGYYLDTEKNIYKSCYSLCGYCESKEINSTYMNCISCRDEMYKLYPKNKNCLNCPKYVNYEQTECINEIPDKFYLNDSSSGIIEKCHELCMMCSLGPTDNSMNCDYCIDGYYLKIDNKNNKNCIPNNIQIEDNFVLIDSENKIYHECYELCATCDDVGIPLNMNCLSCIDGTKYEYDEQNKYCFLNISCSSNYYYTLDENNLKTKICLQEACPEIFPYEIISTKECISSCSYEDLINLICKPLNTKANIEQMKETFENEIEINDEIIEDVLNNEFEDVTVNGHNSTYQITTTTNQEEKINKNVDDAISNIDLGECETIIKKENNISENVSLIILKDDFKKNETFSTQVEYEVYDPISRKHLKLDSCKNTKITISVPLDIDDETLDIYEKSLSQGYDIFNSEDKFYHDVCTVYTSVNGTDMILADRRSDILANTPPICEDGCRYIGMKEANKKALCECTPKKFINLNYTESVFSLQLFQEIFFKYESINYKILGCYKLLSDKNNILHNYGFHIISILFLSFLILIPFNICLSPYKLKLECYKLIQDKKKKCRKK